MWQWALQEDTLGLQELIWYKYYKEQQGMDLGESFPRLVCTLVEILWFWILDDISF